MLRNDAAAGFGCIRRSSAVTVSGDAMKFDDEREQKLRRNPSRKPWIIGCSIGCAFILIIVFLFLCALANLHFMVMPG
jgi:hypothetical protein